MPAASFSRFEKPSAGFVAAGSLLAIVGLAGLLFIFAMVDIDDARLRGLALTLGLAPAALLSLAAQLALLAGCRMLFLAWRRGRKSEGQDGSR